MSLSNRKTPDRVEAWEYSQLSSISIDTPTTELTVEPRREFGLDDHWRRGGFVDSLFAETDRLSEQWRDDYIARHSPLLPSAARSGRPIEPTEIWRTLARYNGCQIESVRTKLQWDRAICDLVFARLLDAGVIFCLPYIPRDHRSNIYYFRDTGILHRLFNSRWSLDKEARYYDLSWEGFVIHTVCGSLGHLASASVWRRGDDEIDLILKWPDRAECWAIEISRSEDKRPSAGFWRGVEEVMPSQWMILHRGECSFAGNCERLTLEAFIQSKAPL